MIPSVSAVLPTKDLKSLKEAVHPYIDELIKFMEEQGIKHDGGEFYFTMCYVDAETVQAKRMLQPDAATRISN